MTEINTNNNFLQIGQARDPLSVSNDPSNQAIAQTSDATANGVPVNLAAQIASVYYSYRIPKETKKYLRLANKRPNLKGIQNLLDAAGLVCDDIAQIAAKSALGFQAA